MRNLLGITCLIGVLTLFLAMPPESAATESRRVVLSETSYAFGTISQGEKAVHAFRVGNEGGVPLRIERAELSEPGLTARFRPVIPPGEEGLIRVQWDTSRIKGDVVGQVIVHFDDPAQPPVTLVLSGIVKPPLEVLPSRALFLSLFRGEAAERTVTVINNDDRPLAITRIEADGRHFDARVSAVTPGKVYEVVVTVPPDTAPGRYAESLYLDTDHPKRSRIRIAVNIFVKENLYATLPVIDFGPVSLARVGTTPSLLDFLTQTVLVKKRQGEFEIKSLTSDLPLLQISQEPTGKSTTFRIDVGLRREDLQPGVIAGSLRVRTDDPEFPELVIPVRGELR